MSDKKIRIKVSELRALVREAMGDAPISEPVEQDMLGRSGITEFRSFDDDFADKLSDKKYTEMAKQLYDAWSARGVDGEWAGVVNLYARTPSTNLATEIDKTKLYEKVLTFVERDHKASSRKVG